MKTAAPGPVKYETGFRVYLQSELTRRCKQNPRYSLRAFAALLKMDPSSVSQILSGKRNASRKVIEHIAARLNLHPEQTKVFIAKSKKNKEGFVLNDEATENFSLISQDSFSFISEWYHYAILELINVENFQPQPGWIARSLGITALEAQAAIERMLRLGLIYKEEGRLVRTTKFVTNFSPGETSSALKELQRQILTMALTAIENVPQEEKDITSITMAIDISKLPEAKKLIAQFRRKLCAFLEDGTQTRVYNLGLQLYPVSKNQKSRNL
jgi:uncharacterized protein (TIGR02147 family)